MELTEALVSDSNDEIIEITFTGDEDEWREISCCSQRIGFGFGYRTRSQDQRGPEDRRPVSIFVSTRGTGSKAAGFAPGVRGTRAAPLQLFNHPENTHCSPEGTGLNQGRRSEVRRLVFVSDRRPRTP